LANIVDDVDSLHVEIDNLNDLLVEFCFIRSIDYSGMGFAIEIVDLTKESPRNFLGQRLSVICFCCDYLARWI
jgi:hypothetical protein